MKKTLLTLAIGTLLVACTNSSMHQMSDEEVNESVPQKPSAALTAEPKNEQLAQAKETPTHKQQPLPDKQAELPAVTKHADTTYLKPRPLSSIPNDEFGAKVKLGYQLFVDSQQMRGSYVGNDQNCVNCHLDAGKKANSAPLWAAYMAYPAYRKKNDKVNSFEDRLQGCFTYSMNGNAPESGSKELVALSAYSYWLAMSAIEDQHGTAGKPVPELPDSELLIGGNRAEFTATHIPLDDRTKIAGRSYPKLSKPAQSPSTMRGEQVYALHCALCHGNNGEGLIVADTPTIPALWGSNAFNWGAGMHRINTAANFIYENMPLGKSIQLTEQQAWDVAAFMNSHERPQDPRFEGNVAATAQAYHQHQGFYGKDTGKGHIAGSKAH